MLDERLLADLQSPRGQALLAEAALAAPDEATFLRISQRLSRGAPERLARAAVEQAILRKRAGGKFALAGLMFFTREALEQATGESISFYRAERFAGADLVFDLGCGIGGDTLGLARQATVVAVDHDSLTLRIMQHNASTHDLTARIRALRADVRFPAWVLPEGCLAFADPARRADGRRLHAVEAYLPPLSSILRLASSARGMGVKLSPAVELASLPAESSEVEFISVGRELKEAVLWLGSLRTAPRRATVLPGPHTMIGTEPAEADVRPLEEFLYEPDPSVLRAGLVRTLGRQLKAGQLDSTIGLLTSATFQATPFAAAFRVLDAMPFSRKRLQSVLDQRRAGSLTIKKRGSPVDVEALSRGLHLGGEGDLTVLLTRAGGQRLLLVLERLPGPVV
jgi:SAM-dependent methyltransferase